MVVSSDLVLVVEVKLSQREVQTKYEKLYREGAETMFQRPSKLVQITKSLRHDRDPQVFSLEEAFLKNYSVWHKPFL